MDNVAQAIQLLDHALDLIDPEGEDSSPVAMAIDQARAKLLTVIRHA
jgi:hypothetical protein